MAIRRFLWAATILVLTCSATVGRADSEHFGIHAVGHAVEPFCPGGYSDRGDHCNHIDHVAFFNDDFDDTFKPAATAVDRLSMSMSLSQSESTVAAEADAVTMGMQNNLTPEEPISSKVTILGH